MRRVFKTYRNKLETESVAQDIVITIRALGSRLFKLLEARIL